MDITQAIEYIENQTWSKTRLGLTRTKELLFLLGDPENDLKFVHVAGTNGKGSTCVMTASILSKAGYKTGFYPSPHLCDFRERIQINGEYITEEALIRLTEKVKNAADLMEDHPSQFEIVTAIGMLYFKEQNCDIVVLEVGMGGAMDSTNVIKDPLVCAITNIGLDHTEYLGDTIEKIAETKGGIIKPEAVVACYDSEKEAVDVIKDISIKNGCEFLLSSDNKLISTRHDLFGQYFSFEKKEYRLNLLGENQLRNAALVLSIITALRKKGYLIPDEAVIEGLDEVKWPARFEVLSRNPIFILDGGHNPQCAEALVENLRSYLPEQKVIFLIGMLKDKDYEKTLDILLPFAKECICITPESPRALKAVDMAYELNKKGIKAISFDTSENDSSCDCITDGIEAAVKESMVKAESENTPVIAFGSLYSAGHIRKVFEKMHNS